VADVRIGAEEARFSSAFIKRSLVPDTALAYTLPRIVGQGVAHELMLTGRMVDAQFALRTGILNRVVPAADLMKDAIAVAEEIAANPPVVVRSTKKLLDSLWRDLAEVVWTEREYNRQTMGLGVKDRLEAVRSFVEKRKPVYTGE
jgi:enoyl-CoA hydratase/carnithine racemase